MHLSELNNRDKEVSLLKRQLKSSQTALKHLWEYRDYVEEIKAYIASEELTGASELWNELEYPVQRSLYIAPLYGGPFTTKERAIIKGFWIITTEDIEG